MKSVKYDSLEGIKFDIMNYESVEEGDLAAGKTGAILEEANKNLTYRGALAVGRSAFVAALEKATGIKPKTRTETQKDDDGKECQVEVRDEKDGVYVKRVRAEKGLTGKDAEWLAFAQPIADEVSRTGDEGKPLAVDIKEPDRKSGPKTLPKNYKEAATRIFANGTQAKWASQLGITYVGDTEKDTEALGWAIRADVLRKQKEQEAQYA